MTEPLRNSLDGMTVAERRAWVALRRIFEEPDARDTWPDYQRILCVRTYGHKMGPLDHISLMQVAWKYRDRLPGDIAGIAAMSGGLPQKDIILRAEAERA